MVRNMPSIDAVKNEVLSFIGEDVIIGHNISFDIRFLNAAFNIELPNRYTDTMQFARKLFPELKHHRLSDLTTYLGIVRNEHRSISDCIATKELYDSIKNTMTQRGLTIQDLWVKPASNRQAIDIRSIQSTEIEMDEEHFFYNRHIVFTGKLERMLRQDAMQAVVNLGGILDKNVTKSTNYLILGNNDYNAILKGKKSSKHKRAEALKLDGQDIDIIDEFTFYELIE